MSSADVVSRSHLLPAGFRFAPLAGEEGDAVLRLGVIIRETPDPVAGTFLPLRQTAEARVFLGAIMDQGGHLLDLVEIWVQSLSGISADRLGFAEALNNAVFDARWCAFLEASQAASPGSTIDARSLAPGPTAGP
jgi:hypothetical protein